MKTGVKHYLQFKDFSRDEYDYLFERTRWIKEQFKAYKRYWPLSDRTLVMIFEKASTRTRLSFEAGVQQLGGAAIYLNTRDSQLGRGEPVEDAAQVISRMSDVIMIRTFEQDIVERLASHSRVPDYGRYLHVYRTAWSDRREDGGLDRRFKQYVQYLAAGGRSARVYSSCFDPPGVRDQPG